MYDPSWKLVGLTRFPFSTPFNHAPLFSLTTHSHTQISFLVTQVATVIDAGVMQWPVWLDEAPITLLTDVLVIISGSLLWRMELANRAESLRMIWQKTQSREESLKKAEAGLGDTLWTSRMRKKRDGL